MSWYGWVSLAVALTGVLVAWRPVLRVLVEGEDFRDNPGDLYMFAVLAAFFACGWPAYLIGWAFSKTLHGSFSSWLLMEPRRVRKDRELGGREARIARVEREMGLDPVTGKFNAS